MRILSYCQDFLKADMQHIYRQITGLRDFDSIVVTRKRENEERFPILAKNLEILPKSSLRFFRKKFARSAGREWELSLAETRALIYLELKREVDICHVYFGNIAINLLPFLRASVVPCVVSFHGADASEGRYPEQLQEVFKASDLLLVRSLSLREHLLRLGCDEGKIRLNRTGLPFDKWPAVERKFVKLGGKEPLRILQACRLVEKKGLKTTFRAVARLCEKYENVLLEVAGDGEMKRELKNFADELGIAKKVTFHGFLGNVGLLKLARKCHVFAHPSERGSGGAEEGVPNAMLEAMATKLPALATWHGGIPEAVKDGVNGFLCNEGDDEALAANIERVMASADIYQKLSHAAREQTWKGFEQGSQIKKLEDIYHEAISKGS